MAFIPAAITAIGSGLGTAIGGIGSALTGGAAATDATAAGASAGASSAASALTLGKALAWGGVGLGTLSGVESQERANMAARYNASAARAEASYTRQEGMVAEDQQRMKTAQTIGAATAAYGASGVDTNTGSPAQVNAQTAQMGEFDALTTRYNYLNRAAMLDAQAQGYQNSVVSPFLTGATDLVRDSSKVLRYEV